MLSHADLSFKQLNVCIQEGLNMDKGQETRKGPACVAEGEKEALSEERERESRREVEIVTKG
jgi:hypothetical protein